MSRRRAAVKREVLPDAKYGDQTLMRFINCLMKHGKKSIAESIVYGAFNLIEQKKDAQKSDQDPIRIFHDALSQIRPSVEVRSRRIGGATYQIPVEVRSERSVALAIRWLIAASRGRSEKTMTERLAAEIMDACHGRGSAMKKREDTHKMAEANKAFAHYRW